MDSDLVKLISRKNSLRYYIASLLFVGYMGFLVCAYHYLSIIYLYTNITMVTITFFLVMTFIARAITNAEIDNGKIVIDNTKVK